ncbi:hypothetical protein [Paenibacillus sp. FSL P4-0288]|uniref:hypothetical protein n=1 Tax=Paenibacillus sp. FSL P4-0288 TaxID=2921633 RepID=UPI0030F4F908
MNMEMSWETEEDILKHTIRGFKEKWNVGYEYAPENLVTFVGSKILVEQQHEIIIFLYYIQYLYKYADDPDEARYLDANTKNELLRYQKDGGLCIHLSIVLYFLLLKYSTIKKSNLAYCQGFYRIRFIEADDIINHLSNEKSGLHAWLELDNAIIDISINQISVNQVPILGVIPENVELKGFRETHECAKVYAKQMANYLGLKRKKWIANHEKNAKRVWVEFLRTQKK